ncbi:MAG: patatin-like phospholipase family protein [Flavobacteriales bacterium]|nr:patatin-like phospholipase family protein [Flavobacteriales bacterium]
MERGTSISLALGSGGARGLAHIGVIQVLKEEGFTIGNIAGTSMGACVGGIYCAGKLDVFEDWITTINKRETFRLMDFTMSTQGMLKGQKVLGHLKQILGEIRIEDFEIPYTAIATDVHTKEEIWMRTGDLYTVIRASSSIPTLMMPSKLNERLLIDGGVLNPLPLEPLMPKTTDLVVAVNINANAENHVRHREVLLSSGLDKLQEQTEEETTAYTSRMVNTVKSWLNMSKSGESEVSDPVQESTLNYLGMLNKTYDFMQDRMCEQSIEIHKPDIVINIPRTVGTTLEFYRAKEMVEEGRNAAKKAVANWKLKQMVQ